MPDSTLEILIRFGLDPAKAREAAAEIKGLKQETVVAGKSAVQAETEVKDATDKTFTSKRQLKDMVKQLGHEFPLLGKLGSLALNPIAAATAGLTAAFSLWHYRVEQLKTSLGGVEMPDVSRSQVERIDALSAALAKVNTTLAKSGDAAKGGKAFMDEIGKLAKHVEDLQKAGVIDPRSSGKKMSDKEIAAAEQAEKVRALAATVQRIGTELAAAEFAVEKQKHISAELKAKAGTPMSEEEEKKLLAKEAELAKAAEAELQMTRERQRQIADIRGAEGITGFFRNIPNLFRYATTYGPFTPGGEARRIEDATAASQQSIINRFGKVQLGAADRAGQRQFAKEATESNATVATLLAKVADLERALQVARAEQATANANQLSMAQNQNKQAQITAAIHATQVQMRQLLRDPPR